MQAHDTSLWNRKSTRRPGTPKAAHLPARGRLETTKEKVERPRRLSAAAGGGNKAARGIQAAGCAVGWAAGADGITAGVCMPPASGIGGIFTTGTRNG